MIEVMGLAVLPARLQMEMAELERRILQNEDLRESYLTKTHADWAEKWLPNYEITEENLHAIVQKEIGFVFAKVLECAGVYKRTPEGQAAFKNFWSAYKKGPFHICEVVCYFSIQFSQIVLLARLCMIYMLKVSFIES